jgi:CheY-like chemotaxis protein
MARILLVDDDDLSRTTVHQMLERAGYDVRSFANGREALDAYVSDPTDLVVTDLIMPDTDGLELIQELRKRRPGARILAISGGGRVNADEYLTFAQKFGAAGVLTKPFSNQELREVVAGILRPNPAG